MAKNREKFKKTCYVTGETCGKMARLGAWISIFFFFAGEASYLLLDNEERKERNEKFNNKK